jgi:hypothetical protein
MNLQLPRRLLVTALLAIGAVSSAQAVNYVEIDGANVKFYYDSDFWGVGAATVTGNSIAFAISDDFEIFSKISTASGSGAAGHIDQSSIGVFAVAKGGYSVSSVVGGNATSSYSFTTGDGVASSAISSDIYGGVYSGGTFNATQYEDSFQASDSVYSTGAASSGSYSISGSAGTPSNNYSAVGLLTQIGVGVSQFHKGRADTALTEVAYNFAVTAVPEPETYAMMIAGLGLVGFAARRRKNAA